MALNYYDQMGYNPTNSWNNLGSFSGTPGTALNWQTNPTTGNESLGSSWNKLGFGDKLNTVFGGLQTLGGLYSSIMGIRMGKEQMRQQRDIWNKTWDAQRKTHNEALETRSHNQNNGNAAKIQDSVNRFSI